MRNQPATSTIVPFTRSGARSYDRRPSARSVFNGLVVLALFKHQETETEMLVSHNDDPLQAVWIKKYPGMLDARFTGRFVVVTLTKQMAQEKRLAVFPILDFDKYLPEERAQLRAAIDAAYRARQRHRGQSGGNLCTYHGRNSFA